MGSRLKALVPAIGPIPVLVEWDGDDAGGEAAAPPSGVWRYNIMVMDEADGQWKPWQVQTQQESAEFQGVPGHTYRFRVRAQDNAGNWEPPKDEALTITVPLYCHAVGDFNANARVDAQDVMEIARRWGAMPGDLLWDPGYDSNQNDLIDAGDVMWVAGYWPVPCEM